MQPRPSWTFNNNQGSYIWAQSKCVTKPAAHPASKPIVKATAKATAKSTDWVQVFVILLALAALLSLSACRSLPTHKPLAPKVSVAAVKPLNLSLSGQKLRFTLRVANPNAFDLPLRTLDFIASFGGKDFAKGVSNNAVTIPANGEAMVDIEVVAGLSGLLGQLKAMAKTKKFDLDYGVKGNVKLDNWPAIIPFDVSGELEEPNFN